MFSCLIDVCLVFIARCLFCGLLLNVMVGFCWWLPLCCWVLCLLLFGRGFVVCVYLRLGLCWWVVCFVVVWFEIWLVGFV